MQYRAFMSYSRRDEATARWLHGRLDAFRTPRRLVGSRGAHGEVPARLHPIFRDRTDLSSGGVLGSRIEDALRRSACLVVLCSPAAAASEWVDREVGQFIELHGPGRIFPVIAGHVRAADDLEAACFPPSLRGRGLLAADLRQIRRSDGHVIGDGRDLGRLKLIAGLLGVSLDALLQRERRRQRNLNLGLASATATFAGLALLAGGLGVLAEQNRRVAEERAAALAADSARALLVDGDTNGALLLLLDAAGRLSPDEASDRLLIAFDEALRRAESETRYLLEPGARLFDAPGGVYVASPDGAIASFEGDTAPQPLARASGPVRFVAAEPNGDALLVVRDDGSVEQLPPGGPRELLGAFDPHPPGILAYEGLPDFDVTPDGALVARAYDAPGDEGFVLQVFDTDSRTLHRLPAERYSLAARYDDGGSEVAVSAPAAAGGAGPAMPGPGIPRAGPAYGTGPDSATAEVAVASAPQRTHHDRGASLPLLASSPLFLRRRGVRAWRFVQPRCRGEGAFGSVPRAGLVAARVRLPEPSARTKGVRQGCPVALGTAG